MLEPRRRSCPWWYVLWQAIESKEEKRERKGSDAVPLLLSHYVHPSSYSFHISSSDRTCPLSLKLMSFFSPFSLFLCMRNVLWGGVRDWPSFPLHYWRDGSSGVEIDKWFFVIISFFLTQLVLLLSFLPFFDLQTAYGGQECMGQVMEDWVFQDLLSLWWQVQFLLGLLPGIATKRRRPS